MIFGGKGEEEGWKVGEEWEQVGTEAGKDAPYPPISLSYHLLVYNNVRARDPS